MLLSQTAAERVAVFAQGAGGRDFAALVQRGAATLVAVRGATAGHAPEIPPLLSPRETRI